MPDGKQKASSLIIAFKGTNNIKDTGKSIKFTNKEVSLLQMLKKNGEE